MTLPSFERELIVCYIPPILYMARRRLNLQNSNPPESFDTLPLIDLSDHEYEDVSASSPPFFDTLE